MHASVVLLAAATAAAAFEPAPQITRRARLLISIGDSAPAPLVVGLYGDAAPRSVALFEGLCAGTLGKGLTYTGSSVSRIERDKLILGGSLSGGSTRSVSREIDSTGYVRSETVSVADSPAYANDDANALSHDRSGLVSMRKGGNAFEFALTPAANTALDATRIVVGEALDPESAELIARLNALPAQQPNPAGTLGGVAALYGLRAGLGFGLAGLAGQGLELSRRDAVAVAVLGTAGASFVGSDPRDQPDLSYRPLTKVRIVNARLLD